MLLSYLNHAKLHPCPWLLNTTFIILSPQITGIPPIAADSPEQGCTHSIWFSCSISSLWLSREGRLKWQQNNARPADWLIRLHLELIKCGVTRKESTLLIIPAAGVRQKKNRWWYGSFSCKQFKWGNGVDGYFPLGKKWEQDWSQDDEAFFWGAGDVSNVRTIKWDHV